MTTCCVAVIGHVDHGKTSLVRALTGTDTDRLPEEKARGLSIAPGFAHHVLPAGSIDFIDLPGHEDFIPAMVSGASGAQGVLVVVSALEGIGAQTREHLRIAALLGITHGVIAVTKADLLEPVQHAARCEDIRAGLGCRLSQGWPMVMCSARSGAGIVALQDALNGLLGQGRDVAGPLDSFLPIDRVFSLSGRGTIVTGTLLGRDLRVGDSVQVQPCARDVSIRGLQSRGLDQDVARAGTRVAVNLRGVAVSDITRGDVLCASGQGRPSDCFDVRIDVLAGVASGLKHMEQVRVLFGATSLVATVRLFGGGRIEAGQSGYAQLRFQALTMGFAGQRAVLRRLSPAGTLGGAVLLDPQAVAGRRNDTARARVLAAAHIGDVVEITQALCKGQGGVARLEDIARLSRRTVQDVLPILGDAFVGLNSGYVSAKADIGLCSAAFLEALATHHAAYPLQAMVPRTVIGTLGVSPILLAHVEAMLCETAQIRQKDGRVALAGHDPLAVLSVEQQAQLGKLETIFAQAKLTPPSPDAALQTAQDKDLFALLIDTGRLVALRNVALKQTVVFHVSAVSQAAVMLNAAFPAPQEFTTSQARTVLGTSRRIIVPVLEYFDAQGITTRHADLRRMTGANLVSPDASTR